MRTKQQRTKSLAASADSAPPGQSRACPHRPPCPGCPRFGEHGIAEAAHKSLSDLARAHGVGAPRVVSGETSGFRHRARLAIRGRMGTPKLGLFELGTHHVVHIPNCSVQHPLINRVAHVVRKVLADAKVTTYSDTAHLGLARYLQVVVERSSQTAQVVLVANSATPEPLTACLDQIRERLGSELHSLWWNGNTEPQNTILGTEFHNWCGPASIVEHFGGPAIHYPPGAFGQNNLGIAERIIEHVRAEIPERARIAEFYAGVGAIGLSVLDRAHALCLNELSPHSLSGLALGIGQVSESERAKISVIAGSAAAACATLTDAQVVIADPPRKGLDPELTQFLTEHPPERFIYVSCGLESFLTDVKRLTERALRLTQLTAFNLMPFTDHVETVARFERT